MDPARWRRVSAVLQDVIALPPPERTAFLERACADPGVQYDTTINKWHTCPNSGRINASNPCSEYMFLDDTACNLASINLMKFRKPDGGTFDTERFKADCRIYLIAQEILVDHASYPTQYREQHAF